MLVPYQVNGRTRIIDVTAGGTERELAWRAAEDARIEGVIRRRSYYEGEQYDGANLATAKTLGIDARSTRLPEHHRLHAYSTHIQESIDFLADQLTDGFRVEADEEAVQTVLMDTFHATDALTGGDEDDELVVEPLLREAGVTQDVPYEIRWDPFAETCFLEFWDSEQVTFVNPVGSHVEKVVRTEMIWVKNDQGKDVQVREQVEYEVQFNEVHGNMECRRAVFWDLDEEPRDVQWLGVPVLPWGLLRANRVSSREIRGQSLVKNRAMDNADRFDAVEQTGYLIARYNSHGNLAVVGDAASIELKTEGRVEKDVADVLTFPQGTDVKSITLPTDATMIEEQKKVTSDAIYKTFGLVRVEPETIQGLGNLSGYALEILNRKTDGTFRRVRRQWKTDWRDMCSLILDCYAFWKEAEVVVPEGIDGLEDLDPAAIGPMPVPAFWDVDPLDVFPNRGIEINMGTGYIVDDVSVRDDFTANLISRKYALKQRGLSEDEIDEIEDDIKANQPTETSLFGAVDVPLPGTQAGNVDTNRE